MKKEIYNNYFDFYYVKNQSDLNNLCEKLLDYEEIAIDTEFTRRSTYYPIISTIQISIKKCNNSSKTLAIIDLKNELKIDNLMQIICDSKVIKIIHASIQDLQIFYNFNKRFPENIIDTQIMASFAGYKNNISYYNLVKEIINIQISKEEQLSDWQKRPLTSLQIDYALTDVLFLHEIYEFLYNKLIINNRLEWFNASMKDFIDDALDQENLGYLKHFSFRGKTLLEIEKIKNIAILREKYAKIFNVPREHLLKNQIIEAMVIDDSVLHKIRIDKEFYENIKKILSNNQLKNNIDDNFININNNENYKKIKSIIAKTAIDLNINEQLLINNKQIVKIIKSNDVKKSLAPWKYNIFGDAIEKVLN